VPIDTTEERMLLDFTGATNATQTVLGIADQTKESTLATSHGLDNTLSTHRLTKSSASAPSC
jgi:hypothetical protein